MKAFFLLLSGVFAVVPGLAVLTANLGVPEAELKGIYTAVVEVFGCFAIGYILVNKKRIAAKGTTFIKRVASLSLILFVVFLVTYIVLYRDTVYDHSLYGRIFFPLWERPPLDKLIEDAGGRYLFIEKYMGDGSRMLISKYGRSDLTITSILLLLVYQAIFTNLVVCFSMLSLKAEN